MADSASIVTAIAAIKNSMDVIKAVKDADYDLDKAILKEKIAILVDSLLEAKIELTETSDLIQEKNKKITELQTALEFKSKLRWDNGVYIDMAEDQSKESPYCSRCWEADKMAIHLKFTGTNYPDATNIYNCPSCENEYLYN